MEGIFGIFIFFVIIALTAVLFFGWAVVTIIRAIIGGVTMLASNGQPGAHRRAMTGVAPSTVRCATQGCLAMNPSTARFCRRCGRGLPASQQVQVRRAAVW